MSTRGVVLVTGEVARQELYEDDSIPRAREANAIRVFIGSDSYPTWLGQEIEDVYREGHIGMELYQQGETDVLRALARRLMNWNAIKFASEDRKNWLKGIHLERNRDDDGWSLTDHPDINYLFHEWIYVIDLDRQEVTCYKPVYWDNSDDYEGNGTAVEVYSVGFDKRKTADEYEKLERQGREKASRYKNEHEVGMNRERYTEMAKAIRKKLPGCLDVVEDETEIWHGGIDMMLKHTGAAIPYYIKVNIEKTAKHHEEYDVSLMFGAKPSSLSGSISYSGNVDFDGVIKQIRSHQAIDQFRRQCRGRRFPPLGNDLKEVIRTVK